jgi:hypothetical protein
MRKVVKNELRIEQKKNEEDRKPKMKEWKVEASYSELEIKEDHLRDGSGGPIRT